ncbi:MAG TPA: hypothetical protein DCL15_12155 [Chloroflexi bacterium]|nr:hypothetical protein [Chloroflexota bacterium]HHW87414.1 hypothetical protein [Chloroflexota bacterium]
MQQQATTHRTRITSALLAVIFLALATVWSSQVAQAGESQWKGRIDAMPANGLQGAWVVAGKSFTATSSTDFRTDKGAFAVGVCVEVEYVGNAEPFTATKIASKNQDDCPNNGGPTPGAEQEAYGLVQSMPASGFVGAWTIGGVAYDAPAGAEFKQRNGPLAIGACAKVHYTGAAAPFTAREIESRPASDCNGTIPPTPTPTPGDEIEVYGRIDSFPSGLIGEWVVDGVAYTADANTEFKQKNGVFAVGACVELHARTSTTPATLREIKTERDHKCNGDDQSGIIGQGELYGEVQSFPDGLVGEWNIAGITFLTDSATEFKQEKGAFAVGVTVKVHFVIRTNGDFYAREIETKSREPQKNGHAFGIVESIPANRLGIWTIGGVEYTANEQTRFKEKHGALEVGARVRVKYTIDSTGQRIARKIETTKSQGGASQPDHLKSFGFVGQMPADGLIGEWTIDNVVYVTDASTKFKEDHGILGIGAYVAVEYRVVNGQNLVHEIETKVPPAAGTQSSFGVINNVGGLTAAAAIDDEVWNIGGVNYLVTPATDLDDLATELEVGNTALVDSYQAADGTRVATQVRGVTIAPTVYLPAVQR